MLSNGLLSNQLALAQQQMQSLMASPYAGAYPPAPGQYGLGDPGAIPQQEHPRHMSTGISGESSLDR